MPEDEVEAFRPANPHPRSLSTEWRGRARSREEEGPWTVVVPPLHPVERGPGGEASKGRTPSFSSGLFVMTAKSVSLRRFRKLRPLLSHAPSTRTPPLPGAASPGPGVVPRRRSRSSPVRPPGSWARRSRRSLPASRTRSPSTWVERRPTSLSSQTALRSAARSATSPGATGSRSA